MTIKEAAKRFKASQQTVYRWRKLGCPIEKGDDDALRDWFRKRAYRTDAVEAELFRKNETKAEADYLEERAALMRSRRALSEMAEQEKKKKLIPVDEISRCWGMLIQSFRTVQNSSRGQLSLRLGNHLGVDPATLEPLLIERDRFLLKTIHEGEWAMPGWKIPKLKLTKEKS